MISVRGFEMMRAIFEVETFLEWSSCKNLVEEEYLALRGGELKMPKRKKEKKEEACAEEVKE